uniref:Hydin adenylate kinase-like domain-containing protein n=1 Tax=Amphimedon queenslandica TaxID=400682 RepID=A0A1X7UZ74_AMPQE
MTDSDHDTSEGINPEDGIVSVAQAPPEALGDSLLNPMKPLEFCSPLPNSTAILPQAISTAMLSNSTVGLLYNNQQLDGYDISPVVACIATYLCIDISPQAFSEMIQGVATVIYGSPYSGKTKQSRKPAALYNVPTLTIDAVSTASTSAGCKAHESLIESTKEVEAIEQPATNGLECQYKLKEDQLYGKECL